MTIHMPARPSYIINENPFNIEMQKKRLERDLSFVKLSEMTGISKTHLCRVERGEIEPSIEVGLGICKVLNINPEIFLQYIYDAYQKRIVNEIQIQCKRWRLSVPTQFQSI